MTAGPETGRTPVAGLLFSYQDPDDYCFVSFNEGNDADTSGIFSMAGGEVRELADISSAINADRNYDIRIEKAGEQVTAYRSGERMATAEAEGCDAGRVGFGTRNDAARFDKLRLK